MQESRRRPRLLFLLCEVALVYGVLAAALHFASPLYGGAVAAALRTFVTAGEGDPPITTRVDVASAEEIARSNGRIRRGDLVIESKTYTELRTSVVPTSFHWSLAFFLALVLGLMPGTPLVRRLVPAAIGCAILFLLHAAFAFAVVRVNTVSNLGDISTVRFSDAARRSLPHVMNFLKFAIDWIPIALWIVPFARSGALRRLLPSAA